MGDESERRIASRTVFSGHVINVRIDTVELPNGRTASREIVEHRGAVAIVAVDDEHRVALVRQFRSPVGEELLEIPAGTIETGEPPERCAVRELAEEARLAAERWELLTTFFSSPGFCTEVLYVYLASGLTPAEGSLDEDELLTIEWLPFTSALDLVAAGTIRDAKSIIGLTLAGKRRRID